MGLVVQFSKCQCQRSLVSCCRTDLSTRLVALGRRLEGVRRVLEGLQDLLGQPCQSMWLQQLQEAVAGSLSRDVQHLQLQAVAASGRRATPPPSPLTFLGRQDLALSPMQQLSIKGSRLHNPLVDLLGGSLFDVKQGRALLQNHTV